MSYIFLDEKAALEAIYGEDFRIEGENTVSIRLTTDDNLGSARIEFTIDPSSYPQSPPTLVVEDIDGFMDIGATRNSILDRIQHEIATALGDAMIFSLASVGKEILEALTAEEKKKIVEDKETSDEEDISKILDAAPVPPEQMVEYTVGTPVTKESFLKWKLIFMAEKLEKEKTMIVDTRPTGRQLFELNAVLFTEVDEG